MKRQIKYLTSGILGHCIYTTICVMLIVNELNDLVFNWRCEVIKWKKETVVG